MVVNLTQKMGIAVDYGDFILIRPRLNYRICAGVILIKGPRPILVDTGNLVDPGIGSIRRAFHRFAIDPVSVRRIFITHSHQDHAHNLNRLKKLCPRAQAVCHEREAFNIQHPHHVGSSVQNALIWLGKKQVLRLMQATSRPMMCLLGLTIDPSQTIDQTVYVDSDGSDFSLDQAQVLDPAGLALRLIPTPGHSAGHTCVLDRNGNLYLGDFVPFTPWITPMAEALDDMLVSVDRVLALEPDVVEQSVRAHGDFRRQPWEVMAWWGEDGERERFVQFKKAIKDSLESIPKLLTDRPLSTETLAARLIPRSIKYNRLMQRWFIPPGLTWTMAYCLKLESINQIRRQVIDAELCWSVV